MKLSALKNNLEGLKEIKFQLPNGSFVESHFHVTEVGEIEKRFIDCGGKLRKETTVNFQLWSSIDFHHRLGAQKLNSIIGLAEKQLLIGDFEIEVEYQQDTIGKYGLDFDAQNRTFKLTQKKTDCLAKEDCGIPVTKIKTKLAELVSTEKGCCTPGGGCC